MPCHQIAYGRHYIHTPAVQILYFEERKSERQTCGPIVDNTKYSRGGGNPVLFAFKPLLFARSVALATCRCPHYLASVRADYCIILYYVHSYNGFPVFV